MKVEGHRSQLEAGVQAAPARQHLDRCVNRAVATPIGEAAGDADGGEIAEYVAEYCKLAGGGHWVLGCWAAGLGWRGWQGWLGALAGTQASGPRHDCHAGQRHAGQRQQREFQLDLRYFRAERRQPPQRRQPPACRTRWPPPLPPQAPSPA